MNREQIRNPHLIYPGYVILLDRDRALAADHCASRYGAQARRTGARRAGRAAGAAPTTAPGTVKLSPRVRAESLAKQEIPSIPPSVIEPFSRGRWSSSPMD